LNETEIVTKLRITQRFPGPRVAPKLKIFMALPWPKIFKDLLWPKIFVTLNQMGVTNRKFRRNPGKNYKSYKRSVSRAQLML
jgi:hypothetical protein